MTAVESLRNWFARKERPPMALDVVGDTIDTRAILELADRMDAIEKDAGPMAALLRYKTGEYALPVAPLREATPGSKAEGREGSLDWSQPLECDLFGAVCVVGPITRDYETGRSYRQLEFVGEFDQWCYWLDGTCCDYENDPGRTLRIAGSAPAQAETFCITGPGRYRTRDGRSALVIFKRKGFFCWEGSVGSSRCKWRDSGRCWDRGRNLAADLVAGPLNESDLDLAGLSGFVTLSPDGRAYSGKAIDLKSATAAKDDLLLDLAELLSSALVKPEPKREARKVWLAFYDEEVIAYLTRPDEDDWARKHANAIVETEVTFVLGEGL